MSNGKFKRYANATKPNLFVVFYGSVYSVLTLVASRGVIVLYLEFYVCDWHILSSLEL